MTYYTDYSIEDCIGLLSRKNIYDVFEYSFEMKTDNTGEITFIKCNKHYGSFTFPPKWITEFMQQKLDAVETIEEDNASM